MALFSLFSKEKKEIRWIGLPCNTKQECQDLEAEKKTRHASIEQKSEILKNLIIEVFNMILKTGYKK